jgi:hypothetical protein
MVATTRARSDGRGAVSGDQPVGLTKDAGWQVGVAGTRIGLHQERMGSAEERSGMWEHWRAVADRMGTALKSD